MANYTDITVVLDRSGSMANIKPGMEKGFDELIGAHKAYPTTRISLVQFDGENSYEVVYSARPITDVPKLNLQPRGWTPLYDALCRSIDRTGQRLAAMKEADRPERVLFVIITDGEENASKEFSQANVRDRIQHQTDRYNWQFTYLGANQNALMTAHNIGIDWQKAIAYDHNVAYAHATMDNLVHNTVAFTSTGDADSLKYSLDQRTRSKAAVRKEDLSLGGDADLTIGPDTP